MNPAPTLSDVAQGSVGVGFTPTRKVIYHELYLLKPIYIYFLVGYIRQTIT